MRKLLGIVFLFISTMGLAFASSTSGLHSLYMPAGNTIAGNPKGAITVVEFFDYNCGYCRMMFPKLQQLIQQDNSLRVIYRDYPILSDRSQLPAEAALAAQKQGKYLEFHDSMMDAIAVLDQSEIMKLARLDGLNTTQLTQDMQSASVQQQLQNNIAMGQSMNIQGVPTFIVVRTTPLTQQQPEIVVGPTIDKLKQMIADAKAS